MERKKEINHLRQYQIFNPQESHKHIVIIGAGGIGSFLTFAVAKCGFENITVFDADIVEGHNVPNQLYGKRHIDLLKVEALGGIVKGLTDVDTNSIPEMVTELSQLPQGEVIYVFALDSLEARQKIYEQLKGSPNVLLDGRMGGEGYQIFGVDLSDEQSRKEYEEQLYVKGSDAPCGMQAIIYTLLSLTAEMCNQIKRIDSGEPYVKHVTRHMSKFFFLGE